MKNILIIIGLLISFASCNKDNSYTIKGEIVGNKIDEVTLLINSEFKKVKVTDNIFEIKGTTNSPRKATVLYGKDFWDFYYDAGKINLKLFTGIVASDKNIADGCSLNDILKEYHSGIKKIKANSKPLEFRDKSREYVTELIKKYSDKMVSADILFNQYRRKFSAKKLRELFNMLSNDIQNSATGKSLNKYIIRKEKTDVGKPFIDLKLPNTNGDTTTLSSVVKNNKITILDFWASWCGPCRHEGLIILKMYKELHDKGLEVYGCSIDKDKKEWLKAIEKDKTNWIHVNTTEKDIRDLYDTSAIPSIFIINQKGEIIANNLRGKALVDFCEEQLK